MINLRQYGTHQVKCQVSHVRPTRFTHHQASTKSILIGGTFSNLTTNNVNITVEIVTGCDINNNRAHNIPVPSGSSFVISDGGKTVMAGGDVINVYCDTENAVDGTFGILQGLTDEQIETDISEETG